MAGFTPTDLRGVIAVAESGHLRDTVRALGIPQPTLSRRIQRVEAAIGADLFDRAGGSYRGDDPHLAATGLGAASPRSACSL